MAEASEDHAGHFTEDFVVENAYGLHGRPASLLVQTAMRFQSNVEIQNLSSGVVADGKSVLSMLMLSASAGTKIRVEVNGPDAQDAMAALHELILRDLNDE